MKDTKIKIHQKNMPILIICLCLGIIFLFLSEYHLDEERGDLSDDFDEDAYTAILEDKLKNILEEMDGVSQVNVMITLEGGRYYRYAIGSSKSLNGSLESSETFLQLQKDSGGNSAPILTEVLLPKVKGVSVVCQGAEDDAIRGRMIRLIASTLDLNANQIYVTN